MSTYPFLGNGHLPPGRLRVTWAEAKGLLVDADMFAQSATRADLWRGLTNYMARFGVLEEQYSDILGGEPLVHFIWIGGSFASCKLDPDNIDLSVALDVRGQGLLRGKAGTRWLKDATHRDGCLKEYGVSPLAIPYVVVPTPFRSHTLTVEAQDYFRERGAWDDWWQRARTPGVDDCPPTAETARASRGYLEVTP